MKKEGISAEVQVVSSEACYWNGRKYHSKMQNEHN